MDVKQNDKMSMIADILVNEVANEKLVIQD